MKKLTYFFEDDLIFDNIMVAINAEKKVVFVSLAKTSEENIFNFKEEYPDMVAEEGFIDEHIRKIFNYIVNPNSENKVDIDMIGSVFQMDVWTAIMKIPTGQTRSYSNIAEMIGKPESVRAVASACGKNKIAVLIPCHRVVSKSNKHTGYRWEVFRKKKLLDIEKRNSYDELNKIV